MDAGDILKVCFRRWYVMLPILVGAAGISYQLIQSQETGYTAATSYGLVEPRLAGPASRSATRSATTRLVGAALEAQLNSRETQLELGSDATQGGDRGRRATARLLGEDPQFRRRTRSAWGRAPTGGADVVDRVLEEAPQSLTSSRPARGLPRCATSPSSSHPRRWTPLDIIAGKSAHLRQHQDERLVSAAVRGAPARVFICVSDLRSLLDDSIDDPPPPHCSFLRACLRRLELRYSRYEGPFPPFFLVPTCVGAAQAQLGFPRVEAAPSSAAPTTHLVPSGLRSATPDPAFQAWLHQTVGGRRGVGRAPATEKAQLVTDTCRPKQYRQHHVPTTQTGSHPSTASMRPTS